MAYLIKEIKTIEKILLVEDEEATSMEEAIRIIHSKDNNNCRVVEVEEHHGYEPYMVVGGSNAI